MTLFEFKIVRLVGQEVMGDEAVSEGEFEERLQQLLDSDWVLAAMGPGWARFRRAAPGEPDSS